MNDYESKRIAQIYKRMVAGKSDLMKHVIGLLRTSAWFERIRAALRQSGAELFTPYAVGQHIQPDAYVKGGGAYHRNMWAKYAQGQHVPSANTVGQAELFGRGSSALLNSPLWWMLDCTRPLHMDLAVLDTLSAPVRDCLFDFGEGRPNKRRSWDDTLDRLSERANGLEALAAGVWVLREAWHSENRDICLDIGEYLHNILLMALASEELRCIRYTMIAYFFEFVFPLCGSRDMTLNPDPQHLLESAETFEEVRCLYEDYGVIAPSNDGDTSSWYKLFYGTLGWDLRIGLGPDYGVREGARNPEARLEVRCRRILRRSALAVLCQDPAQYMPPKALRLRVRAVREKAALRSGRLRDAALS